MCMTVTDIIALSLSCFALGLNVAMLVDHLRDNRK